MCGPKDQAGGALSAAAVPDPRPPLPTQNTQAARFALDQAAWMLCFVSPALTGSSFTYAEHPGSPIRAGSGCLDALLRVPRPCGLLLYLRRTPRHPDPDELVFEFEFELKKPSRHF